MNKYSGNTTINNKYDPARRYKLTKPRHNKRITVCAIPNIPASTVEKLIPPQPPQSMESAVLVMAAFRKGKQIQLRQSPDHEWTDVPEPTFDFKRFNYRIKP